MQRSNVRATGFALFTVALALVLASRSEAATITFYTDRSSWEAAVVGMSSTEDFSGIADTGQLAANVEHTLGLLTFSYTGAPGGFPGPGVQAEQFVAIPTKASAGGGTTDVGLLVFEFPFAVLAWGADFTGASGSAFLDVTMAGETIALVNYLPSPGDGFFGVVSDTPFNQVVLSADGGTGFDEFFFMDNVSFGEEAAATPVPEPTSLLLFGTGALGVLARTRRRKQP
jgi:hypothetical protein